MTCLMRSRSAVTAGTASGSLTRSSASRSEKSCSVAVAESSTISLRSISLISHSALPDSIFERSRT